MERPQSTIERLEQAADAATGVRFVGASVMPDGEPAVRVVAPAPRRGPGRRRRPAGPRPRPRRPRRHPRTDQPRPDDDRPRLLDGRHRLDGAAAADAHGLAGGVRRVDPGPHPPRRRQARADRRPCWPRSTRRRPATRRSPRWAAVLPGRPRRAVRRAPGGAGARSRAARDPAVHERVDERAEGRDDPRPGAHAPTSTPAARAATSCPSTRSWCRGCRCTTTWGSSGAWPSR